MGLNWQRDKLDELAQPRHFGLDDLYSGIGQALQHVFDHPRNRLIKSREVIFAGDSQSQAVERWHYKRRMIACHYGIEQREVGNVPSMWSYLVEETADRSAAIVWVPPGRRAEACDPA